MNQTEAELIDDLTRPDPKLPVDPTPGYKKTKKKTKHTITVLQKLQTKYLRCIRHLLIITLLDY